MNTTRFPPTPIMSSTTTLPTPASTIITSTISAVPPVPLNDSNPTNLPLSSTTGPSSYGASSTSGLSTWSGLSNPTAPGVMMSTTVVQGIFGVGANFDPLIIVGLVVAGLIFLLLLGALIYCCCTHCCVAPGHSMIKQPVSFQTIRQERVPNRPIYLTASFTPEYSSSAEDPAASVFLEQPLRVSVGAYAAGNGGRMRQQMIEPDVIVTRRPTMMEEQPVVMRTLARKKYMYPADVVGLGNDVTYNTIRPTIISRGTPITTLGDGYAIGHSLRSTGNNYGNRNLLLYDDDPAPRIITLY